MSRNAPLGKGGALRDILKDETTNCHNGGFRKQMRKTAGKETRQLAASDVHVEYII